MKTNLNLDERSVKFFNDFDSLKENFWDKGYVIIPKVFTGNEIKFVKDAITNCAEMNALYKDVQEKFESGKYPSFESIFVMNDVFGDDIFSKITRNHKLLDTVAYLFDDDAYVYHNKVTLKYGNMPGFKYHQDYFYWYKMGCLFPAMATCFIAIDKATKENGCLKIMPGSHKLGRVDHQLFDGFSDSEVEEDRLNAAYELFDEIYVELDPGDAVLFHCNIFHGSNANLSENSRIALLGCYNTKNNSPINREWSHPPYSYQKRIFDEITESDAKNLPDFEVSFQK